MSLEQVKNEILQDARRKAEEIKTEATREKEEMIEEAEEKAEKIKGQARLEAEKKAEQNEKRELSKKRVEEKKKNLNLKAEKIDGIFEEFENEVEDVLRNDLDNVYKKIESDVDFEVGLVKIGEDQELEPDVDISKELDEPGIVVVSADGSKQVSYTLSNIVDNFKQNQRKKVAEILFEE